MINDFIRSYVFEKLLISWSPEQISGRIRDEHPGNSISHEAIYQYIYEEHPDLIRHLRYSHRKRKRKGQGKKHKKSHIPNRVSIEQRPDEINNRTEFGHWEGDTALSRQSKGAMAIMTERVSRYTLISYLAAKTSRNFSQAIIRRLVQFPDSTHMSMTYDNGSETVEHEKVNKELNMDSYFCTPYHSWEKGTVENAIGLIREYLPKKTDFDKVKLSEFKRIENLLNNRPRKCLNYKTPLEVFRSRVALAG